MKRLFALGGSLATRSYSTIPIWNAEECIRCLGCIGSCPVEVIDAFHLTEEEIDNSPTPMETSDAVGKFAGYEFCIHVSPEECLQCGSCIGACPVDALEFDDTEDEMIELWEYLSDLPLKEPISCQDETCVDDVEYVVLYGSQTGNAQSVAELLNDQIQMSGRSVALVEGNLLNPEDLTKMQNLLVVVSTIGQGEMPHNIEDFFTGLNALERPELDLLGNLNYCVFGLGDSSYEFFCQAAKELDDALFSLGGLRMCETIEADDQADGGYAAELPGFLEDVWDAFELPEVEQVLGDASYDICVLDGEAGEEWVPKGTERMTLKRKDLLTKEYENLDHERGEREVFHYEFVGDLEYGLGDSLGIWPQNSSSQVSDALDYFGLSGEEVLGIETVKGGASRLPEKIEIDSLFRNILDLTGRPSYDFLSNLKYFVSDEGVKERIESHDFGGKSYGIIDVLRKFGISDMPLEYFVSFCRRISPRLYSIASSPLESENQIDMCIVTVDWPSELDETETRFGLCTGFLRELEEGQDEIHGFINPTLFEIPEKLEEPAMYCALGTGLAPFRAFLQERKMRMEEGKEEVGESRLFFGTRYADEIFYENEFREYEKTEKLGFVPHFAISREGPEKRYIQHEIVKDQEWVCDALYNKGGYVYYCGGAGVQQQNVKDAIIQSIHEVAGIEWEDAENFVEQMVKNHKFCSEAW